MSNRLSTVLIVIGVSLIGMPTDAGAQLGNPLRSFTDTPRQPTSTPASNHLIESAREEMTAEQFEAAFQSSRKNNSSRQTYAPKLVASPAANQNVVAPAIHASGQTATDQRTPPTSAVPDFSVIHDSNVRGAVHVAEPKRDFAPRGSELGSAPVSNEVVNGSARLDEILNRLHSTTKSREARLPDASKPEQSETGGGSADPGATKLSTRSAKFDQAKFQRLIQQLITNTFLVMAVGVGFILIAKRWVKGGNSSKGKTAESTIEIKSTLKLSPKSSLHLVEAGEQRLIVANDQNGIKTVVPLTKSFDASLDSFSDMAVEELDAFENLRNEAERPVRSKPAQARMPKEEDSGVSLSLSQSLLEIARKASADRAAADKPRASRASENEMAVRKKMEAALREHGFEELIQNKLRSNA